MDLFGNLVSTAHGQPSLPPAVPVAQASFDALPDAGFDRGYARLWEAYGYIRRGKHLAIPAEWKELLPKPL